MQEAEAEDCWGQKVYRGEHIVIRIYYQKWGRSPNSYILCDMNRLAFIYFHLIITAKFSMEVPVHHQRGN
jgi:hypothetical protein